MASRIISRTSFASASEAFHAISHEVPVIKAWERQADGTVTLLNCIRLKPEADGSVYSITLLPLMFSADFAKNYVAQNCYDLFHSVAIDSNRIKSAVHDYLATGKMPSGLSSNTRKYVAEEFERASKHVDRKPLNLSKSVISQVAAQACFMEEDSLKARIVARALGYSRGATGIAKLINSFLWSDVYDREIARAAILIFGRRATIEHYNVIVRNWSRIDAQGHECGLKALSKTHRAAFPIAKAVANYLSISPEEKIRRNKSIDTWMNFNPSFASDPQSADYCDVISRTAQVLKEVGFKPALWRFLLKCSIPQLHCLSTMIDNVLSNHRFTQAQAYIGFLNRLSDFNPKDIPFTFLREISFIHDTGIEALTPHVAALVDGARIARKNGAIRIEALNIRLVVDFLTAANLSASSLRNARWSTLMRAQQEWHERANFDAIADLESRWDPIIGSLTIGNILVTELTNGRALYEEGRTMHHCVAGYSDHCMRGNSRVFSLVDQSKAKRRSTLELSFSSKWQASQHRSYCNMAPESEFAKAVSKIVRAVNAAQKSSLPDLPLAA